jgi:transglutaminase-like putative cysteine protease
MYPIKHAKVQALVKEALGDAQASKDKVARLVAFVHRYIQGDYKTRPHSVLQLLEVRRGACTEYALLFTTLARAAGIPAREVTGLYYLGDDEKAFGPHAWSEVVLDGQWVPVDPAWGETELDAAHLTIGSTKGDKELNLMVDFLSTFGKVSFKLIEVKTKK